MMMCWKSSPEVAPNCPRCASANTKFCYYNNYSISQPRYFCKACRRYWTKGGSLRNVPVGGGCRKTRRPKSSAPREDDDPPRRYFNSSISPASAAGDVRQFPGESAPDRSPPPVYLEEVQAEGFINGGGDRRLVDRNSTDELEALLLGGEEEDGGQWSIPTGWQQPMVVQEAQDFGTFAGVDDYWTAGGSTSLAETTAAGNAVDDVWRSFDLSGYETLPGHYY
ncbi:hypothetical protein DM860_005568 [Cuscuta australis]|uniref:Dof zinc finger protein n=1 Tax=Cuscuta australis TaxID=267555 RepID=A0A328DR89_9ASTE|nr:hypothetical protein DM860_005568 [Cuscuta australis]